MARLSFAIALNLITDGFKKGTNQVKNGINSIKSTAMSAAAYFGVGFLGIKAVFDKIKDAGLQTAKAINVLKANSGGIVQTGQNLRFIQGVANKYKLELTGLITEYSRFTAAATTAGFSVKQQQTIFEGVQKAIKGYRLDEEASSTVMGSLQKMMNTGTISTRNFTNSFLKAMPQAKRALADAMGVGVDKINALVKKGIDAKQVMESFAKNLKTMSPTADTGGLASAKNRISNAFSGIAQDTSIVKWIANITNKAADLIEYIRANARSLAFTIGGLLAGIKISQFFSQWKIFSAASSNAMVTNATVAHAKIRMLESSTNRLKRQIAAEEVNVDKLSADERLAAEVQLNAKKKQLAASELALTKAKNTAKVADERAAAVQSGNAWTAAWAKIKTGAASVAVSLKAIWSTVGPMILITLITEIISKLIEWKTRVDGIKNAFKDYKSEAGKAIHTKEIIELEQLRNAYNNTKKNSSERLNLEARISNVMGQHLTGAKQINDVLNKRIKILEAAAEVEYYTNKKLELQDKQDDMKRKYGGNVPGTKKGNKYFMSQASVISALGFGEYGDYKGDTKDYKTNNVILSDINKKLASAESRAGKLGVGGGGNYSPQGDIPVKGGTGGGGGSTKTDPASDELKQAEESYAQQLRELAAKKKLEGTSDADYSKAVLDATNQALVQVSASKYASVSQSDFAKALKDKSDKLTQNKSLNELNARMAEFDDSAAKLKNQFQGGAISQQEYTDGLNDLISSTKKDIASIADVNNANMNYVGAVADATTRLGTMQKSLKLELPQAETRDTTFDYKKSDTDIMSEQLEIEKNRLEKLKSSALSSSQQMVEEINKQMGKVDSLDKALKLAEVRKDVKAFAKELRSQTWSSIKSIMSGSDQIVSSWQQLGKTLNSTDASGWEKIMAIWNALSTSVDGILNIIDAVKGWTKASDDLKKGKEAEQAIVTGANAKEIVSNTTAAVVSTTTAETEASDNTKTVAGNMAAAGSEVVKNNAKIPVVGIALAAAGLVAILALMNQLPKFAKGGIVGGGGTSGDNMLARVNSGEMILNGSQQRRLFNAINGGALGGETQISLTSSKVRGSDMYLAIDNYMKSKNKKWSK